MSSCVHLFHVVTHLNFQSQESLNSEVVITHLKDIKQNGENVENGPRLDHAHKSKAVPGYSKSKYDRFIQINHSRAHFVSYLS